jgi:hypothetical protein
MRSYAVHLSLLFLLSCAGKLPAGAPPDPPLPEGWWVETADEVNANDIGTGARFVKEGAIIVPTDGHVIRPPLRLQKSAPREWWVDIDKGKATIRQTAADALVIDKGGKRILFRAATPAEAKQLDARAAAPEPAPGE